MPTLGLTYVTYEDYMREHPEIVERFLKAVLHGIEWARDNRDEAIDIVLKYAPGEEREHQRFMLDTELAAAESDVTQGERAGLADGGAVAGPTGRRWASSAPSPSRST